MPSYTKWNHALVSYFTYGVPPSTKVYLSVDDDVLERIGYNFSTPPTGNNWGDDFRAAVKTEVIIEERVCLDRLQGRDFGGFPKGVAFLAATVLAAYQMAETDTISELNYFKRLREILSLPGSGRPLGMKTGSAAEEPLWKEWNLWLMQQGFLPSAQRGRGGSTTYINYPISQSLLRGADKDRLLVLFKDKQWTVRWDAQTLFARVRKEASSLWQHLKELVTEDRQRYEAVAEAIHEIYVQWQDEGKPERLKKGVGTWSSHLFAGLCRIETDPFLGLVDYYVYPKSPRGRQLESLQVQHQNRVYQLRYDGSAWYPLECRVNAIDLDCGAKYQINYPADLDSLILPDRDFWILIPDPENPDSGTYGSWGTPSLGTPFILLYKEELRPDLERLRDEQLIKWHGSQPVFNNSNWVELHQCMVVSQAWDGVIIKNQELKDALQPSVRLSLSFSGGLRVPQMKAWLFGHSPQITVFAFYPKAQLQITRLSDNFPILDKWHSTNTPISVEFPSPSEYLVKAIYENQSSERFIKIVNWDFLGIEKKTDFQFMLIDANYRICGSVIEQVSEYS